MYSMCLMSFAWWHHCTLDAICCPLCMASWKILGAEGHSSRRNPGSKGLIWNKKISHPTRFRYGRVKGKYNSELSIESRPVNPDQRSQIQPIIMPQWRARNAAASQAVLPGCRAISSQLRIFRPKEIDKLLPCFWQLFSCCASSEWGVFAFLTSLSPSITYITSVNLHLICLWVSWHLKTALKFSILFMQLSFFKKNLELYGIYIL